LSTTERLRDSLAIALLSLFSLHCGAVGEPRPPLLNIPERAADFVVRQTAQGIVLEWTWPRVTTEGVPLNDLACFDVYGFELAAGSPAPDAEMFEREGRPLASMQGDDLKPYGPGERVRFVLEREPLLGKLVALGVRAESQRGRSVGFSNLVVVEVVAPPGRPEKPSVTLTRDAIVLEWLPAERAASYVVERGANPAGPFEPRGRSDSNSFRDTGYQTGETYVYRVRAIARGAAGEAEGLASEAVAITPRDTFAPDRPAGLRAVATETAVELSWEQNAEPDLAGYRLRRRQQDSEAVLVQDELLPSPSYSDRGVARGQSYAYDVTAVDEEGNESPPSEAIQVSVPD
jgi:hypothetical protein